MAEHRLSGLSAPTLSDIETLAAQAFAELPESFRRLCGEVVIAVEDFHWAEHEETLGAIVTHVLVHEIGHHFGLSDDDMYGIEDRTP